jgi:hypothetical protein
MNVISRRMFVRQGIGVAGAFWTVAEPAIEISISVLRQDNCRADREVGFIRLDLKCSLLNKGVSPILIAREPKPPHIILLAVSLEDHKAGKFAHEYSSSWYRASEPLEAVKSLAVAPGRSYEWRTWVQIPVSLPLGRGQSIAPGRYWMSVLIEPWPEQRSSRYSGPNRAVRSHPTLITITDGVFQPCP